VLEYSPFSHTYFFQNTPMEGWIMLKHLYMICIGHGVVHRSDIYESVTTTAEVISAYINTKPGL
jgi:hypothetical protein